jgi:hypothetical protein
MVADPVLIDTARHYAELDALDALERYTEAHGEPSWETWVVFETSIQRVLRAVVEIIFG